MQQDKEEENTWEKKKKDLASRLLVDEDDKKLNQEMTLTTRNFKNFLKKKAGSKRFDKGENKAKEYKESNK